MALPAEAAEEEAGEPGEGDEEDDALGGWKVVIIGEDEADGAAGGRAKQMELAAAEKSVPTNATPFPAGTRPVADG